METVLKKDIKQAVKCTEHDASSVSDTKATLKSSKESTSKTADLSDVTLSDDEDVSNSFFVSNTCVIH